MRIKCVLFLFTRFRDIQEQESFGIDDVTLVTISTKDLNKILRTQGITKKRSKEIKIERRRLKNREYNKLRRLRRLTQVTHFFHEIARVAEE